MYNCAIALLLLLACHARAEFLTFDSRATWEANWSLKPQLNIFTPQEHLGLIKFRKDINAVLDAHLFVHPTNERGDVAGGIWSALSNPTTLPGLSTGMPPPFGSQSAAIRSTSGSCKSTWAAQYWPKRSASTSQMKRGLGPSANSAFSPLRVPTWRL